MSKKSSQQKLFMSVDRSKGIVFYLAMHIHCFGKRVLPTCEMVLESLFLEDVGKWLKERESVCVCVCV